MLVLRSSQGGVAGAFKMDFSAVYPLHEYSILLPVVHGTFSCTTNPNKLTEGGLTGNCFEMT